MKQAILITAYKNIEHLTRIVNFFDDNNFFIYIHIDRKSKVNESDIALLLKQFNVKIVSRKYKIKWGGLNHLKAILYLLREAIKEKDTGYFHMITGHDFPIKTLSEIISFVETNNGKEFIETHKLPYKNWMEGGIDRVSYYNFYDIFNGRSVRGYKIINNLKRIQRFLGIKRKFSPDFPTLYGGSTYWSLSRPFIEYALKYIDEHPSYLRRFKYTFCSEEMFFQTLIMNSPFEQNVTNISFRLIIWEERNGNIPANLDESDYDAIVKSDALFARKFEFPVSQPLLNKVEIYLKNKQ